MAAAAFVIAFLLLGTGVIFVAYSGGPGRAREAYLTGGRGFFKLILPLIYLGIGIAVPAIVIANGKAGEGGPGRLADVTPNKTEAKGKQIFRQTCSTCHSLAAVNARGVTGPNLDEIGQITKGRVLSAIKIGGTGQGRMPAGLLTGENATAVATYLSQVAGRGSP
jgi:mono/diheme cytochrome c family protein